MGFKILVLAAIGLASLYMLHLLAQDYNKIRKPVMKLARFLGKRDTNTVLHRNEAKLENFTMDWNRIISNDPLGCARSLICQISAGAERENPESELIEALVHYGLRNGAPIEIENAYIYGVTNGKDQQNCSKYYPYCPYSAHTMLKFLQIYSYLFDAEHTL